MADAETLDKAYQIIITRLVETGQAPHYTELAAEMGCATEEGRQIVHDLAKAGPTSIRLNPDTDWISTVPPPLSDTYPVPDYRGWSTKMVRSMRPRLTGCMLAVSW